MKTIATRVVGVLCAGILGMGLFGAAGCGGDPSLDTTTQADGCESFCQTCTGGACGPVMNNCGQIVQCDGTCPCTPTCGASPSCGQSDGCGGTCRGSCPGDDEGYNCWVDSDAYCGDVWIGTYFFCR